MSNKMPFNAGILIKNERTNGIIINRNAVISATEKSLESGNMNTKDKSDQENKQDNATQYGRDKINCVWIKSHVYISGLPYAAERWFVLHKCEDDFLQMCSIIRKV